METERPRPVEGHINPLLQQGQLSNKLPHLLMVPYPMQGHINPLMQLAHKIVAETEGKVLVTFLNTKMMQDMLEKAKNSTTITPSMNTTEENNNHEDCKDGDVCGNEDVCNIITNNNNTILGTNINGNSKNNDDNVIRPNSKDNIRMMGLDDGIRSEDLSGLTVTEMVALHCKALLEWEPKLLEFASSLEPPVSCIIADIFVPTTVHIAKHLGIPHVAFWTQSAASYVAHEVFVQNPHSMKEHIGNLDTEEKCIDFIPCGISLRKSDIPTFLKPCDPYNFIFSYIMSSFKDPHLHSHVLLNTIDDIEVEALKFINKPNISNVGPLLPLDYLMENEYSKKAFKLGSSIWAEDDQCLPWLDQQKASSVLYVSFGSLAALSLEQVLELVMGLQNSECPILMVIRQNVSGEQNDIFLQSFAKKLSIGHSMCVGWAPQLEVLAHPSVGGFLTHTGWNSTLESLSRGVPMLCWPFFADQLLDCRLVVDAWKVGLDFNIDNARGLVCQDEIKAKVNYLMDPSSSKEIRDRAQKIRQQAKSLYMNGGKSKLNFKSFLEFISKLTL